ncbi:MAG: glycosyltransferase [Eubacteriales bacterium]|nr:glycosyltransferase [Eubacteriales bacterium]
MKIAMMTNNYKPFVAGVPVSVERLTVSLRNLGHETVVFAPTYENMEMEEGVVRYRSLVKSVCNGAAVPDSLDPVIERAFCEGNFDVIHVHHPMAIGWTALHLSQKYRVPVVFTYHTRYEQYLHYLGMSWLKNIMPAYIRAFASKCDGVIAPTPGMKEYLNDICVETPVSVLPTGILAEGFYPDKEKVQALRGELAGDKKYLFCTVARLAKEKNLDFLLESLSLRKGQGKSDFRLALVGEGPEGARLKKRAEQLDLKDEIVFVGKVPNSEIKNYCAAADWFLFTSTTETQGIVSLEAMAAGTPVLAVDATGTRDIVKDGENGYLTKESVFGFEKKLDRILRSGADEIARLKEGARITAYGYSEEATAVRALSCYQAAMELRWRKNQKLYRTGFLTPIS